MRKVFLWVFPSISPFFWKNVPSLFLAVQISLKKVSVSLSAILRFKHMKLRKANAEVKSNLTGLQHWEIAKTKLHLEVHTYCLHTLADFCLNLSYKQVCCATAGSTLSPWTSQSTLKSEAHPPGTRHTTNPPDPPLTLCSGLPRNAEPNSSIAWTQHFSPKSSQPALSASLSQTAWTMGWKSSSKSLLLQRNWTTYTGEARFCRQLDFLGGFPEKQGPP